MPGWRALRLWIVLSNMCSFGSSVRSSVLGNMPASTKQVQHFMVST